jgi:poly-gamma-glutamate capsule biosynthesis protein CapA/YwtB (metallophosphatase superfamily)
MSASARSHTQPTPRSTRLFLCGDVMTGRGIDQILPHPCDPVLHEDYTRSAIGYLQLAEAANGPIPRSVGPAYIWGAAMDEFARMRPHSRIINLETSITHSEEYELKGINYRMSPENAECLRAAAVDCCVLGNNHILDWGHRGLLDTLSSLERLHIRAVGAGRNLAEASAPAVLDIAGDRRLLLFSLGCVASGIPHSWAATSERPGVNLLSDISEKAAVRVAEDIARVHGSDDLVVVSVHWGANWGYAVPNTQRSFAHTLIDRAGASIVHGHSSHHPKAIEVYHDRLILYGCGDFLNDYEGISGYEKYRDDLVLMYFADIDSAGTLAALEIVPLQIRKFQLVYPSKDDICWMQHTLDRECRRFGTGIEMQSDRYLALRWKAGHRSNSAP